MIGWYLRTPAALSKSTLNFKTFILLLDNGDPNILCIYIYIYIKGVDVVEWSRALDVRLSEWCCSVTMVWVQIPSREEQKFDSSKI
jgi:hypothetical protein